jgi:hypothetical protein
MNKVELPEICFTRLGTDKSIIIIKKGESGYYKTEYDSKLDVDELNKNLGVTKGQEEAMSAGSMFGWECEGADPNNYNDDGTWKNYKENEGGK